MRGGAIFGAMFSGAAAEVAVAFTVKGISADAEALSGLGTLVGDIVPFGSRAFATAFVVDIDTAAGASDRASAVVGFGCIRL